MRLIGISDGHNASACYFDNGTLKYAIQEERLTGIKNYYGFPTNSIERILELFDLEPAEVDRVIFGTRYVGAPRPPRQVKQDIAKRNEATLGNALRQRVFRNSLYARIRAGMRMSTRRQIVVDMGFEADRVDFVEHHTSHAATAYYGLVSDFSVPHLVLTVDGRGDGLSATVSVGKNGSMERTAVTSQHDSLGEIYTGVTHYMGFVPLEHEYKLMGMAPYAGAAYSTEVAKIFSTYLDLDPKNPLMFKRKIPEPTHQIDERLAKDLRGLRFDSICGGLQLFTESLLCRWVSACIEHTGVHNVVAAGGVFMNVKANKALLELDGVESFEAFPSCGDETLGIGACLLTNAQRGIRSTRIPHYYLGDTFSDEDVERELAHHDFSISKPASMPETAAKLLEAGHPVARCAGPMEFGARALGNRSILANPKNPDVVRVINRMIKKRDFWMPFAPVVRRDRVDSYFSNPKGARSPFMMMTFDSKDNYTELLAAVHNADLTARAQIVEPGQNDELEAILDAFESRTGQSVLLNTSFNLHGFPIVCGPKEALDVFAQTGLEFMVLGSYLVSKRPVEQVLAA